MTELGTFSADATLSPSGVISSINGGNWVNKKHRQRVQESHRARRLVSFGFIHGFVLLILIWIKTTRADVISFQELWRLTKPPQRKGHHCSVHPESEAIEPWPSMAFLSIDMYKWSYHHIIISHDVPYYIAMLWYTFHHAFWSFCRASKMSLSRQPKGQQTGHALHRGQDPLRLLWWSVWRVPWPRHGRIDTAMTFTIIFVVVWWYIIIHNYYIITHIHICMYVWLCADIQYSIM